MTASHNPPARQRLQGLPGRRRPDRAAGRRGDLRPHRRGRPAGRRRAPRRRRRRASCRRATTWSTPTSPARSPQATAAAGARDLRVVYTPMHGVGRDVLGGVLGRGRLRRRRPSSPSRPTPDPDFPTVAFPNPEEPGALDLALALAAADARRPGRGQRPRRRPPGRRPARPRPRPAGWRPLTGDEIGVVLADWLLAHGVGPDRLVATTIVSSSMLARLAAARGVAHAETLTGFKWIARAALDRPDLRFVYGYEEALGSCVGTLVRDKDGITAALAFAELVAAEKAAGRTRARPPRRPRPRAGRPRHRPAVAAGRGRRRPGPDARPRSTAWPRPRRRRWPARPVAEVEDLRLGGRLPPTDGVAPAGRRRPADRPPVGHRAQAQVLRRGGRPGRRRRRPPGRPCRGRRPGRTCRRGEALVG